MSHNSDNIKIARGVSRENQIWGYVLRGSRQDLIAAGLVAPGWLANGSQKDKYGRTRRTLEVEYGDFRIKTSQHGTSEQFDVWVWDRTVSRGCAETPGAELSLLRAPNKPYRQFLDRIVDGAALPDFSLPPAPTQRRTRRKAAPAPKPETDVGQHLQRLLDSFTPKQRTALKLMWERRRSEGNGQGAPS